MPSKGNVAIVGAGDYIGSAIARRFCNEGFSVFAGRRNGKKLHGLRDQIADIGGIFRPRSVDARISEQVATFLAEADAFAPLDLVVFNIGANVNFPIVETTDRVFRKVWEMACFAGFVTGREAARIMQPRKRGKIFFTGATAGLRGGVGFAAFASAKFGIRAVAQSMARELWPDNIHVAHLIIDAGVDTEWVREIIATREGQEALDNMPEDRLMPPAAVGDAYWSLYSQPQCAWTFELEIRPYGEEW